MSERPAGMFIDVPLPARLHREVEEYIAGTEFTSVAAFVAYVLSEVMAEDGEADYSADDEAKVRDRLRALGYIE